MAAMQASTPCEALRLRVALQLRYGGFDRTVEVHAVGLARSGRMIMRVWQVRGGSAGGEPVGWKLMHLDEVCSATLTDEKSLAPRADYTRNDPAMARGILCQV
jgi:hypothetical protein